MKARSHRGVTLVESAMVIGVISLVILGALLALESVTQQRRMTQAVTDAAMIRSAISRWAAGGLLSYPPVVTGSGTGAMTATAASDLTRWDQIGGFLPGALGLAAERDTDTLLENVNPWSSNYRFTITTGGSAIWTLNIEGVPDGLADLLGKQLLLNGGDAAGTDATNNTTVGALSTCSPAGTAGDDKTVCVSYEE